MPTSPGGAYGPYGRLVVYAAAVCVAAFEATVLYWSAFPRVSHAYASYYIRHDTGCYSPDAGPVFALGQEIRFDRNNPGWVCNLLDAGWLPPETWGTWSNGQTARLHVRLTAEPKGDPKLTMEASAFSRTDHQTVTIYSSGRLIGAITIATEAAREYRLIVPRETIRDRRVELEFRIADPVSRKELGRSKDSRRIGLGLAWLRFDPADDTHASRP